MLPRWLPIPELLIDFYKKHLVLSVLELCVNEMIEHILLYVWLLSLMVVRFTHVVVHSFLSF